MFSQESINVEQRYKQGTDATEATSTESQVATKKQARVVLWAMPRSGSTALFRAMWNKSSMRALIEPFARAYFMGEERLSDWFLELAPPIRGLKFQEVRKNIYEDAYPDADEIFSKDMAMYVIWASQTLHKLEDLMPKNYVHTFLIRKPELVIKSLYKVYSSHLMPGWNTFRTDQIGFKEIWELYSHVKENIEPNPLVIDADDLMSNPEAVLRTYCERTGLRFEESMLSWDAKDGLEKKLELYMEPFIPFLEGTLKTSTIMSAPPKQTAINGLTESLEFPPEVAQCIEENNVWYQKLLDVAVRF